MNEFKGTQGEWSVSYKVYQNEHGASYVEIDCMKNGSGVTGLALVYEGITEYGLREMHANALLISKAPELLAKLQSIVNISEDKGTEGCTWGDTDMSSTDVVFGYNLALEHVKGGIEELIKQATEVTND